MRHVAAAALIVLAPLAAFAQPAPGQGGPPSRSMTRDQFVQRASEMAGRRFDMIDTAHTGVVTREQIRAFRQAHQGMAGRQAQ